MIKGCDIVPVFTLVFGVMESVNRGCGLHPTARNETRYRGVDDGVRDSCRCSFKYVWGNKTWFSMCLCRTCFTRRLLPAAFLLLLAEHAAVNWTCCCHLTLPSRRFLSNYRDMCEFMLTLATTTYVWMHF
jgi:hypothetical protein